MREERRTPTNASNRESGVNLSTLLRDDLRRGFVTSRPIDRRGAPRTDAKPAKGEDSGSFETTILHNLRKAGVQNTSATSALFSSDSRPSPDRWIQAAGEYADAGGASRRVAISIGPEHGTVGPRQVQEAAEEAVRGIPFDLLLVLGFASDPHAAETAREISREGLKIEEGSLYRTKSRPFAPPTSGKIAVKVINHYGDEVLRVYEVAARTVAAGAIVEPNRTRGAGKLLPTPDLRARPASRADLCRAASRAGKTKKDFT
jgi:hypothetical protein